MREVNSTHWTPFFVKAIRPSIDVLIPIVCQPLKNKHLYPQSDYLLIRAVVNAAIGNKAAVIPFQGLGIYFEYSWKTIAHHMNKGKPIKLDGRKSRLSEMGRR